MLRHSLLLACVSVLLFSCGDRGGNTPGSGNAVGNDTTAQQQGKRKAIDRNVTIAMNGDMMLGTLYPHPKLPPNDGKEIFVEADSILRSADVACGNCEGVLADKGKPRKRPGPRSFSFLMPTRNVGCLVDAGYDFVGIANNHIFDFWDEGRSSTIATLKSAGIGVAGTPGAETAIKTLNGVTYGFCAFGHEDYSLRTQDTATVKRIITELRPKVDILIVCFHGGCEGSACRHLPYETEYFFGDDRGNLREFTHRCIDLGADIVYGHGPHVVRAIELYKDHFIAYSLGNFATPVGMGVAGLTGYAPLITATIDPHGRFVSGKINGFIQQPGKGPRRAGGAAVIREIKNLTLEDIKDNKLNIADDGTITKL